MARSTLLAQISHDLRSPLTSIIGFVDLLQVELGPDAQRVADYTDAIRRNGRMLMGLVEDLLDVSSIDAGRLIIRRTAVAVTSMLADVRAVIEPRVLTGNYVVIWPDAESLRGVEVSMDRKRMAQALVNLIDNACAHTPRAGQIRVDVTVGNGEFVISVQDSGPGVALADQERIFMPFVRVDGAHRMGSGLGLAIVRGIAQGHGGRIGLVSQSRQGARFTLAIPTELP